MHIERVTANGFGALPRDSTLELGPGLNVVTGPNEAAKSTWHAALYAALCGQRRSRGQRRKEEKEFQRRHEPRSGGPWQVSAQVRLADGRRVELTHDLAGRVACRAQDRDLGRDVSNEIMTEGSPDASRWLGLDRRSFASTAVVRQAQLLGVLEDAEQLQEQLQHAAATAGTESTAAAALERLTDYERQHVGREMSNSTRPLQTAVKRVRAAESRLVEAELQHAEYLELGRTAERRQSDVQVAQEALTAAEADLASRQAGLALQHEQQRAALSLYADQREERAGAAVAAARAEVEAARTATTEALALARDLVEQRRRELAAARGRLEVAEECRAEALGLAQAAARSKAETERRLRVGQAQRSVDEGARDLRARREAVAVRRSAVEADVEQAAAHARAARQAAHQAQSELDQARTTEGGAGVGFAERLRALEDATAVIDEAQRALTDAEHRVERLVQLDAELGGQPARDFLGEDDLAVSISAALCAWATRPPLPELEGVSAESLRAELEALPQPSDGDRSVAPGVESAARTLATTEELIARHDAHRPAEPTPDLLPNVNDDELRQLARDLVPGPPQPILPLPSLTLPLGVVVLAVLGIVVGIAVSASACAVAGVLLLAAGGWLLGRMSRRAQTSAELRVRQEASHERQAAGARAQSRCRELGCEPTIEAVQGFESEFLCRRERARREHAELAAWTEVRPQLVAACAKARDALEAAIQERGFLGEGSSEERLHPDTLLGHYSAWCRRNEDLARLAARRGDLAAAVSARGGAERAVEHARQAVDQAARSVRAVADAAQVAGCSTEELVDGLRIIDERRRQGLVERDAGVRRAAAREQLLDGQTAEEVGLVVGQVRLRLESMLAQATAATASRQLAARALEQAQQRVAAAQAACAVLQAEAEDADLRLGALQVVQIDETDVAAAERVLEEAQEVLAEAVRTGAAAVEHTIGSLAGVLLPEHVTVQNAQDQVAAAQSSLSQAETACEVAHEDGQRRRDIADEQLTQARAATVASARQTAAEAEALQGPPPVEEAAVLALPRAALAAAREGHAQLAGTLEERMRSMPDIAAAKEELSAAVAEEGRMRALALTLAITREFLERAQEEVHRDFAPRLVELVRPWLRHVTDGRYIDLQVDPQTLRVTVYDGQRHLCDAGLLSRGTTEQVYLLLRIALAQLLVTAPGESTPLFLDDVTVQCDPVRTNAVLQLLHRLSADRQIVLFSQEVGVTEWAQQHLSDRDRLVELDPRSLLGAVPGHVPQPRNAAA